mgnify:CR=1 FL=1
MITLILVIIVISLLILVHEWGHFYSARKFGVKVEEFGFGFPPKIFSRVKNGIRYSFNLLPFGGFVKIFGEHGEGEGNIESFASRPAWQRFIILSAGVLMNFILAWVFFSIGSVLGVPHVADEKAGVMPVSIIGVESGSPADKAGLRFGDQLLQLRSLDLELRVESENDVRDFVDAYRGEEVTLMIKRGEEIKEILATPRVEFPEGEGPLGIALARLTLSPVPWYWAPFEGALMVFRSTVATVSGLWGIVGDFIFEGRTKAAVSGPIGIFFFANDIRTLGLAYFVQFVGILSVNLAILNFLPIPALDGGRVFFLALEKIRRKRIDPKVENMVHTIGFVLLILLMVAVTYGDVVKIL